MKTITYDEFRQDPTKAHELAHSDEGVAVIDENGAVRFTIWIPNQELAPDGEECRRQLHEALGLNTDDTREFSWKDLLGIVRDDLQKLNAVRKAVAS